MYIYIFIAGFGGGALRGIVGFIKHQFSYKQVGFNLPYFLTMTFLSGIVGLLVTAAIQESGFEIMDLKYLTPALAFIIGYGGGDFLENIYKILTKRASFHSIEEK